MPAVARRAPRRRRRSATPVYMERYLENPRHVEVQVLADEHKSRLLGERDCSMQRRHQKIIEETPAPRSSGALDAHRRARAEACRKSATAAPGTFDSSTKTFFFIEMNTRVQVEHPVTEMITGIDIVQEQIRIAAGQKLRFGSTTSKPRPRDRMPDQRRGPVDVRAFAGPHHGWHAPGGPGIRVDSHAYQNYLVPPNYDSMIGKVIAYGDTREQAIAACASRCPRWWSRGIRTNIPLHQELLLDEKFLRGGTTIHYLEERLAKRKQAA